MNEQLDYIFFFYGFSFIVLAAVCLMPGKKQNYLSWTLLGLFGIIHGLNEWLDMLAMGIGDSLIFKTMRICVMAASYICLIEFGRLGTKSIIGKYTGRWIIPALFLIGCTGYLNGWIGLNVSFRYSLGFIGGIWSAFALILVSRKSKNSTEQHSLFMLGILFAAYAIASGIIVPKALFMPASFLNQDLFLQLFGFPIQLLRGILALASAIYIWQMLVSHRSNNTYRTVFVCFLLLIFTAGWYFTNRIGENQRRQMVQQLQSTCNISAASISSEFVNGNDWLVTTKSPHYRVLKERLIQMQKSAKNIRWIYIIVPKKDHVIYTVDSTPEKSKDYMSPGFEYTEAPAELKALCRGKGQKATSIYKDRWGKWISAFVTVRDDSSGKPIAVLGMDYPQAAINNIVSNQRLEVIAITFLIAILAILLFYFRERREWFIVNISNAIDSLHEKEEYLSCTLHSIGDAVITTDCDGCIIRMNPVAEILTGWSAIDAFGRPVLEVFHIINALTRELAFNPIAYVLATGEKAELANSTIIVSKDGIERQIADSCSPICDNEGNIIGVVLVFRDVTREHSLLRELRESEEKYRFLFEDSRDALMTIAPPSWKFTSCNQATCKMFGVRDAEEFIALGPLDVSPELQPDGSLSTEKTMEKINKAMSEGECFFEWTHKRLNGEIFSATVLLSRTFVGEQVFLQATVRDITELKQIEAKLRETEHMYKQILDSMSEMILCKGAESKIIWANKAFRDYYGMTNEQLKDIIDAPFNEPDYTQQYVKDDSYVFQTGNILDIPIEPVTRSDGEVRLFHTIKVPISDDDGKTYMTVGVSRDITDRKYTEDCLVNTNLELEEAISNANELAIQAEIAKEALKTEKDNLAAIFAASPVGMILLDEDAKIVDANFVIAAMVSKKPSEIINKYGSCGLGCIYNIEHEKGYGFSSACNVCSFKRVLDKVLKTGTSVIGAEIQAMLIIDGHEQHPWFKVSAEPVFINKRKHVIVAVDDITDRKAYENKLDQIAHHDTLTGLPNRMLFNDRLNQSLIRARRNGKKVAVMFFDLDKFKLINDKFGHTVGDMYLQEVASKLTLIFRESDTAARMGGDEFVVNLNEVESSDEVIAIAKRALKELNKKFSIDGHELSISASIGISIFPSDGEDAETLICNADAAMYSAKKQGANKIRLYNDSLRIKAA